MRYEAWLVYDDMALAVENKNGVFHCSGFISNQERKVNLRICYSTLELKFFLLSLKTAPKKEILLLINRLENNKVGEISQE